MVEKEVKYKQKEHIPAGIKLISILTYIVSIAFVFFGVLILIMGILSLTNPDFINGFQGLFFERLLLLFISENFVLIFGFILVVLGILGIFVAKDLWKGKNWARIFMIAFSFVGMILAVYGAIKDSLGHISTFIIYTLIAGYLLFSKKVKEAFS